MKKVTVKFYPDEIGESELIKTYCCSSVPVYFVEFDCGYSTYFDIKDVKEIK